MDEEEPPLQEDNPTVTGEEKACGSASNGGPAVRKKQRPNRQSRRNSEKTETGDGNNAARTKKKPPPAVKKKQPDQRPGAKKTVEGKLCFFWCPWKGEPRRCEILMKFILSNPELLGRLEREMKPLANTKIQNDGIRLTAVTPQVESATWETKCEELLSDFFRDYTVQMQKVLNFHPNMLKDQLTQVETWDCRVIAVCGLNKDVARKIHQLKETDMRESQRRICRRELRKINCPYWLFEKIIPDCQRAFQYYPEVEIRHEHSNLLIVGHPVEIDCVQKELTKTMKSYEERTVPVPKEYHGRIIGIRGQTVQELQRKHQVVIVIPPGNSPYSSILIRGEKSRTKEAETEIMGLVQRTTTFRKESKEINCPYWLFEKITSDCQKTLQQFPAVEIRHVNSNLLIMGRPHEIDRILKELTKVMKSYEEISVTVPKEHRGMIIGKGGQKVQELQSKHQVFIVIPPGNSPDSSVLIRGEKSRTKKAETEITDLVEKAESNKISTLCSRIPDMLQHRITQHVIQKVKARTGVSITRKNDQEFLFTGKKDKLDEAESFLTQEITAMKTVILDMEQWMQKYIKSSAAEGSKKWPEVKVEISDTTISLTGHPSETSLFQLLVSKKIGELRETLTCTSLDVDKKFHSNLIGKGGKKVKDLKKKYKVEIAIPKEGSDDSCLKIEGEKTQVATAIQEINDFIHRLETATEKSVHVAYWMRNHVRTHFQEVKKKFPNLKFEMPSGQILISGNVDEVNSAYSLLLEKVENVKKSVKSVSIPLSNNQLLGVIGCMNENINKLRKEFPKVNMRYGYRPPSLNLDGSVADVERAHIHIVQLVGKYTNYCILEVHVDSQYLGRLIGRKGSTIDWLRSQYPLVTRIDIPGKNGPDKNVLLAGEQTQVDGLFNHLQCDYLAHKVKYHMKVPRRHQQEGMLTPSKRQSFGSMSSLTSAGYEDDDLDSNISLEDETPAREIALYISWTPEHLCLLSFVKESPDAMKLLKEALGEDISLNVTDSKIEIAGQGLHDAEGKYESKLEQFFSAYSYYETEIHPKSSVDRNDTSETDLRICWDEFLTHVEVYGVRAKVEEKKDEFEQIKRRKKAVSFTFPCNKYLISFMKAHSGLNSFPERLGKLTDKVGEITVSADIPEVMFEEEWEAECKNEVQNLLAKYSIKEIPVPPIHAGEMREYCSNASLDAVILWNRKKKVSVSVSCENQDILNCVKESVKFIEKFVHHLGELGSPKLGDRAITINSEIFEKRVPVQDSMINQAMSLKEIRTLVTTKWLDDKKCLLICGKEEDVNMCVGLINKLAEAKPNVSLSLLLLMSLMSKFTEHTNI